MHTRTEKFIITSISENQVCISRLESDKGNGS